LRVYVGRLLIPSSSLFSSKGEPIPMNAAPI
jgi:hypothetical protein